MWKEVPTHTGPGLGLGVRATRLNPVDGFPFDFTTVVFFPRTYDPSVFLPDDTLILIKRCRKSKSCQSST